MHTEAREKQGGGGGAVADVELARLTPQCVVCKQEHVVAKETRAAPLYGKALK